MSYILEALRRSQAERERGRIPGLDAQPAPGQPDGGVSRALPIKWVASGVGVAALLLVALAATWWSRTPKLQPPQVTLQAGETAAMAPPLRDSPPVLSPPPQPAPQPQPQSVQPTLPQVVSAPPALGPAPLPARPADAAPASTAATPPVPSPPARPPQVQAPAAARALTLAELSPDQRRELPAMAIGGSIWSDNAANRFVIVNGQVVREGEAAAPGATLERIGPKSVILRWRDLRVEVPL